MTIHNIIKLFINLIFLKILDISLERLEMPNLKIIAESSLSSSINLDNEVRIFLELILYCAVNCRQKKEFIMNIMGMEEPNQKLIMVAITKVNH
jgi:hypothetical protein